MLKGIQCHTQQLHMSLFYCFALDIKYFMYSINDNNIMKFKKAKRSSPRRTRPIWSHHDNVLKRNKVDVQAYHGRSFIGNHCIKYLKIKCTRDIGTVIRTLTSKHTDDTSIKRKATLTAERLKCLNEGFRTIYTNLSHCRPLVDSETNQIKRYVKAYMKF